MSESSRLFALWTHPARTFQDIALRPTFLIPLMMVTMTAFAYAAATLPTSLTGIRTISVVLAAAAEAALKCIATALVLTLVAACVYSAPIAVQKLLAIVCYSMMPGVATSLLAVFLIKLQVVAGQAPHDPMITNLAAFLDPAATSKFTYTLAGSVDLITIWEVALIAQGLRIAAGGALSCGAAARAVLFPLVIYVVGRAAIFAQ